MKQCTKCSTWRELSEFGKDRKRRDGLNPHCKYCTRSQSSNWQRNNRDKANDRLRKFHDRNPNAQRNYNRTYYDKNAAAMRTRASYQRADRLRATPTWADHERIRELYDFADHMTALTGVPHEVDHIVPLRSKLVCGLNWEGNMRVTTRKMNRAKSNKTWPDMP